MQNVKNDLDLLWEKRNEKRYKDFAGLFAFVVLAAAEDVCTSYTVMGERMLTVLKNNPETEKMLYAFSSRHIPWILKEMEKREEYYDSLLVEEIM